jgi:acetolactate synthase-1/2/3 large subunit
MGQVARGHRGREGFQEVDVDRIFDGQSKWAAEVSDPARLPELVSRAFHRAVSGRPGPVVLAVPEDLLLEPCDVDDADPYRVVQAHPGTADLEAMQGLLAAAERPLALVGGATWTAETSRDMLAFAEANGLPTAAAFRCQDSFDNRHELYVGEVGIAVNPALARRIAEADLMLAVGPRLGEATTSGYTLLDVPRPRQRLVHVHPGTEELGRVYQADVPINSGLPQFAAAARALPPVDGSRWAAWAREARADYLRNIEPQPAPGAVNVSEIVAWLRERLPADAIVANGAGNYTVWAHRFYQFSLFRTQLAPTSGAMGYGVPAAVAASLQRPESIVVCFSGDGDFLMNGQELATAVQYGAAIVVLVVNNGMYGTIRMHQERQFPGHVYGTDLVNPDFVALARSFGAHAELVARTEDFVPAFERALDSGLPALIELRVDPEAITPRATLTEIREAAQAGT